MTLFPEPMKRFPHPRTWGEVMRSNIKLCKDEQLRSRAAELVEKAEQASAASSGGRLHAWVPFRKDDLGTWCSSTGRLIALGDAAHLMPPTLGWGANCALGDARSLANEICRLQEAGGSITPTSFKAYEEQRRAMCQPLVAASVSEARR